MSEADAILVICAMILGGQDEVRINYDLDVRSTHVEADCETEDRVIEVGLDKRSSLDSFQQAAFFGIKTGKTPMIVIVDRDGVEGPIEYRIETVARAYGMEYRTYSANLLSRWRMTEHARKMRAETLARYSKDTVASADF